MKLNFPLWIFSIDFFQTSNWLLSNSVTSIIEFLRLGKGPFIYYVGRFWNIFWPTQSQCKHDLCTDSEQKMLFSEPVQSLRNIWMVSCTRNDASFKNVMISIFDFNFRVRNLSRFCWIAPRVELSWSTWKRDMKIMVFKQCWQKTFMAFQGENIEKKNFPSPSQICKTN